MKIRKGDQVKILLGKDRGKSGKVLAVFAKENKLLVEGVNVYKRHVRKMGKKEGGILDIVKKIDISNASLICPSCQKTTRVGFQMISQKKMRICRHCQKVIEGEKKS